MTSTTMAANRDEILANFQACTGIVDFMECLAHLEQNDWNLTGAINSVFSAQGDGGSSSSGGGGSRGGGQDESGIQGRSAFSEIPMDAQEPVVEDIDSVAQPTFSDTAGPSSGPSSSPFIPSPVTLSSAPSSSAFIRRPRFIQFSIKHRGKVITLSVTDEHKVDHLKDLLSKQLNIPKIALYLSGWDNRAALPSDETTLSTLHLPAEVSLTLSTPTVEGEALQPCSSNGDELSFPERLMRHTELVITDMDENTVYNLRYEGCKTILDVKQGIFALTNVQPRRQEWIGWPNDMDTLTLAASGIDFPRHILSFKRLPADEQQNNRSQGGASVDAGNDSSDSDEYDDAQEVMDLDDHAMFGSDSSSHRDGPLLPDNLEDATESLIHFSQEFSGRYGNTHPNFYMGPLEDAIKEAFNVPAKDRKLLAVYVHHDKSVQSNVFCSQLMCSDSIVNFLNQNFVTWAWDMTSPKNRERLLTVCTKIFGSVTASTLKNLQQDKFPLLLLVMRIRSNTEVFSVLQGNLSLDELMTSLIQAVDFFTEQQQADVVQEEERRASLMLKLEQDQAYQESLIADRAKQEEKERQEREEGERIMREQQEEQMKKAEEEAIRLSLEQQLADEPDEGSDLPISTLRMRLPTGETMTRRFLASEKLQMVLVFLGSKGYHSDTHKILTTWPKRDLTSEDGHQNLQQLGLCPQETLFVEER
ncbi:FAS-associated factor 1-like [Lytechinus pictus]|uniref:FAS-associated factor 1-like n=1 Tax=Lytechinus pictus TaxID=7653 RepID=UPI0030B9F256